MGRPSCDPRRATKDPTAVMDRASRRAVAARSVRAHPMARALGAAVVAGALLAAGCASDGAARDNEIVLATRFSGSGTDSTIDTNGDGIRALFVRAHGLVDGLGRVDFTEAVETQPRDPGVACVTPDGLPGEERELVQGQLALVVDDTGDALIGTFVSDTLCAPVELRGGSLIGIAAEWAVTGGTGRFEGATGTIRSTGTVRVLLADPTGTFVIASAEHSGTVALAR